MATEKSARPGIHLPWAGKKVQTELVEEELTTFWHLAADNMRISQNMNVRTSVLNFVICVPSTQSARMISTLLRDLSSTHIARATLLILDTRKDLPTDISTWVTLRSFPVISDLMRHHFEQVTVLLTGDATRSAATVIQSLLKPDLPVYLWWYDDLCDDQMILQRLIHSSNRAIVDSQKFTQPIEQLQTLSALTQTTANCAISDLNWSRITIWRELIAQFFDVAQYRPYLVNSHQIEIEYAVSSNETINPLRALLLAAWIKTRLGWHLSKESEHRHIDIQTGTYNWRMSERTFSSALSGPLASNGNNNLASTENIEISIRPRNNPELSNGTICLVRASSIVQDKQAVFTIERDDDEHITTRVDLPYTLVPPRTVNTSLDQNESILVHNELEIMGRDHLYEAMLQEVIALIQE